VIWVPISSDHGDPISSPENARPYLKPKETTTKALKAGDRWSWPSAIAEAFGTRSAGEEAQGLGSSDWALFGHIFLIF